MIIAGGGTGGHVYPGVAIYESLRERLKDLQVMFIGSSGGVEEPIFATYGVPYRLISGRGLRGASVATKVVSPLLLARSVFESMRLIHEFRPGVVIGTGGFASASTVVAALLARLPLVLQEQNSVPGLVNRRLARFADLVLLSFESSREYIPKRTANAVVGNPLRRMPAIERATAAAYFGLDAERPTILVAGGSRGAHSLNVAGCQAAAKLAESGVQTILLTGETDHESVRTSLSDVADRVKVLAYLNDMHMAYAAADVAVARAGASSVFELAAHGIPTIFVPYPHAADDHQARNVAPLLERKAAVAIVDRELTGDRLVGELSALLADEQRHASMSSGMKMWARPEAADAAAGLIAEVIKKNAAARRVSRPRRPTLTTGRRATLRVVRR